MGRFEVLSSEITSISMFARSPRGGETVKTPEELLTKAAYCSASLGVPPVICPCTQPAGTRAGWANSRRMVVARARAYMQPVAGTASADAPVRRALRAAEAAFLACRSGAVAARREVLALVVSTSVVHA